MAAVELGELLKVVLVENPHRVGLNARQERRGRGGVLLF